MTTTMAHLATTGIRCGACKGRHRSIDEIQACSRVDTWPCTWLVEYPGEDWPEQWPCGAPTWHTNTGYRCFQGHVHVNIEYAWGHATPPSSSFDSEPTYADAEIYEEAMYG